MPVKAELYLVPRPVQEPLIRQRSPVFCLHLVPEIGSRTGKTSGLKVKWHLFGKRDDGSLLF